MKYKVYGEKEYYINFLFLAKRFYHSLNFVKALGKNFQATRN